MLVIKKNLFALLILMASAHLQAQDFETKELPASSHNKPMIFYLSGDGGFNKFSNALCENLNHRGYDVIALNCREYFWHKRTPASAAIDIANFLTQKFNGRPNQQLVLIGYSFGADVLPFIVTLLPNTIRGKISTLCLMASSGSTDFEIHWTDILGGHSKRNNDVITELNKLTSEKVIIISASDDKELDYNRIVIKYKQVELPGGHHFDGDTNEITQAIVNNIN